MLYKNACLTIQRCIIYYVLTYKQIIVKSLDNYALIEPDNHKKKMYDITVKLKNIY